MVNEANLSRVNSPRLNQLLGSLDDTPPKGKYTHNLTPVYNQLCSKVAALTNNKAVSSITDLRLSLLAIEQGLNGIKKAAKSSLLSVERAEVVNNTLNYLQQWVEELEKTYESLLK